jgi:hypothetical protein
MVEHFEKQIDFYPNITEDVLNRVEFKTVWSGKRIAIGDKILYAFVYLLNTDDLKFINFLERELNEVALKFKFVRFDETQTIPILAYREDIKKRD